MTSRERVEKAINHQKPDCIPLDLGSTPVTGMAASSVWKLRHALGLKEKRIKVVEPYQMLGEIDEDLKGVLGVDCIELNSGKNLFGFENKDWKSWELFDGTPVLVPGDFNTEPDEKGDILMYPEGDRTAPPSARMPKNGFYFDTIIRQLPIDEAKLKVEDNLEEFQIITDKELEYYRRQADYLYKNTDYAIVGNFGGTGFGDIALVPAPFLKYPKGIRDVEEWYISTVTRKKYIYRIFEKQCEIALQNLEKIKQAVSNKITVIYVCGADFGMQEGPFISPKVYKELYKPFHKEVNDWIHKNTKWKTFKHSCGGVEPLINDFIDAGFDILNPVQISAVGMELHQLKEKYGKRIVFWGGGVDTQRTLPFGTPEDVSQEVREHLAMFSDGGYVFNPVHNIQAGVPVANLLAMYKTFSQYR